MVAIVSGNNLGLNLSSLASIGPGGQFGGAALGQSGERTYVDVSTGNLVVQEVDSSLVGIGSLAATVRTYNSQGNFDQDNGDGWRGAPYKSVIQHGQGAVIRTDVDGSTNSFVWDGARYVAQITASQALDIIEVDGSGNWVFTDGTTGRVEVYQGTGQGLILSSSDPNGNTLSYTYDAGNLLRRVDNSNGESVLYTYAGRNLAQVESRLADGSVVSHVSYTYDLLNRLETVAVRLDQTGDLPAGSHSGADYVTTYAYDGNSTRIASVTQGDQTQLQFTYVNDSGTFKVATVTDGLGRTTAFNYDPLAETTTVIDPLGVASRFEYDARGQLETVRLGVTAANPAGLSQLAYEYNGTGDLVEVTDGLGRSVVFGYENGNQRTQTDALGNTLTRTFDERNQVLTETIFAQADRPLTTRYVYDDAGRNRLRFMVSAEGRVTEYRYLEPLGLRESAIVYAADAYSVQGLATDVAPTEDEMAAWVATADRSQTERTDFAYDHRGQLQRTTTYAQTDGAGNGIAGTAAVTQFVYDQHGQLLETITPSGAGVTHMVYDGLGRLVVSATRSADASIDITTLSQYDDLNARTTVRLDNGLATVSVYDRAGQLVSVAQNAGGPSLGTTRFSYDEAGRLAMTEEPTGARSWVLHDGAGRKVATIGPDGQLVEFVYDSAGRLTQTIGYAHKVDPSSLADGAGVPLTQWNANPADAPAGVTPVTLASLRQPSAQDQKSWNFYDAANRLCFQVDALGHVTQTQYDNASRVTSVRRLADPVNVALLGDGVAIEMLLAGTTTSTTLAVTAQGAGPNAPRTLVAQVTGGNAVPGGMISFYVGNTLLGSAVLSGGSATLTVANLPAGLDALTAVYAGDAQNLGSTSAVVHEAVAPAFSATTTLTASAASAQAGATVTLTATVAGLNPTGLVIFYSGTTAVGLATLSNGVASLDVNHLPGGSNVLTAVYQGDDNNARSVSAAVTEVITSATSTTTQSVTTLLASNASALPGQPVTLTAKVSGAVPSGTVEFYRDGQLLGQATLDDGLATLVVSSLPVGVGQLTARYLGDGLNNVSLSATTMVVVLQPTTTALVSSPASPALGAPVTLTASIAGASPTGVVNFYRAGALLGSAAISNGAASLQVSTLPLGASAITATYSGDGANVTSVSAAASVTVVAAATTTTLGVSSPTAASGEMLTLIAQVSGTGAPAGTVEFFNDGVLLGSAPLVDGVATFATGALPVGTARLRAAFVGTPGNTGSTSAVTQVSITAANTTRTTLASSSASTVVGSPVTVTATIGGAGTPGGTVTFFQGATNLGTAAVVAGQASLTLTTLPPGTASVTAVYSGDATHASSSAAPVAIVVARSTTQLALTSSAPSSTYGAPVTFTATLSGGVNAAGTVTFFAGTTVIGTATLANGAASLTVNSLPVGVNAIGATYSGDAGNVTSVASATQSVAAAPTTTTLTTSQASIRQGSALVLTAVVGSGTQVPAEGTVTFYSGATAIGSAPLSNGLAAITVSSLAAGTSVLTASYAGSGQSAASVSGAVSQAVVATAQATTTSLASSASNVRVGELFTLTATVTGNAPGGTVTFLSGLNVLGTATVNASGVAQLTTMLRASGNTPITATFSGDAANATSVAASITVRATNGSAPAAPPTPPATTTTLTSSAASALRNDPITFFARVDRSVAGAVPGGTVSFFNGTTLLGSAALSSGQATLTLTNLPVGAASVRAVYSGDGTSATSTSGVVSENISLAPSSVTLAQSAASVAQGSPLTLTARVAGNAAPAGTVTFYRGATVIGTVTVADGLAALTVASLPVGTSVLTARYSGDTNNALSTSATSNVVVTAVPASTNLRLAGSPNHADAGEPITLTATVRNGSNPSGTVSFFNGSTLLGSAAVAGGEAVLAVTSLPVGSASIVAVYSGDAANAASTSTAESETIVAADTTTSLAVSSPTSAYGSAVLLTATVTGTGQPGGTVDFFHGTTLLGSASLSNGQASLSVASLPVGTDPLRAVYAGDASNTASTSAIVLETVSVAPSSLALASAATVAPNGAITVQVNGAGPTGDVVFMEGQVVIGTAAITNGFATLNGSGLPPGTHTLTAMYGGDGRNAGSATSFGVNIVAAASATTLSAATPYVAQNAPLVLTAHVAGSDPTGTVTFYSGSTALGTAIVTNGLAAITIDTLDNGTASLTAVYSGDANNTASMSAAVTENVFTAPVNIALTSSGASVAQGNALTLTARVTGDNVSGTVAFVSGRMTLGAATLVNGVATLNISALNLGAGTRDIVAVYLGDGGNAATMSQPLVQTVTPGISYVYASSDADDRVLTHIEDADGRLRATVDAEGYFTELRYNAAGRLVETVRYANEVEGFVDAASIASRVSQARATGSLTDLRPDADTDADVHSYIYYNARGQRVGEVDGEGYLTEYSYDINGNVTEQVRYATAVTGPLPRTLDLVRPDPVPGQDHRIVNTWDALNRLETQTNGEGTVTSYGYDAVGRLVTTNVAVDTAELRTYTLRYDVQGRVVAELSAEGAALLPAAQNQSEVDAIWAAHAVRHSYDAVGRRESSTDANGHRTVFVYDDASRLRYTVNAEGDVRERRYGALGRLEQTITFEVRLTAAQLATLDGGLLSAQSAPGAQALAALAATANQSVQTLRYDVAGRLVETEDAEGGVVATGYNAFDEVERQSSVVDGVERVSTSTYDRRGLTTERAALLDGRELIARSEYDAFGRVFRTIDPNGNTREQAFDRLGRVIQTTDALGEVRGTSYDAFSRVLTRTDALGHSTSYSYDRNARSVTMTTPEGVVVTTAQTRHGQTHQVTDGNGNTTTFTYDRNGNLKLTEVRNAAGALVSSGSASFDNAGRLLQTIDANGIAVDYTYDAANRLLTRTLDPLGLALDTRYTYDAKGRQVTSTDPNGVSTRIAYDLNGRVLTHTVDPSDPVLHPDGLDLVTRYSYNSAGDVLTVTSPGDTVTSYVYDALGRRIEEHLDPLGQDLECLYAYDDNGNMVRKTDANGHATHYVYDANDRMVFSVGATGSVRETRFDDEGRSVGTTAYATAISLAGQPLPLSVDQVRALLQPSASDFVQDSVLDLDGRLAFSVDGAGGVTAYERDGNGNTTRQISYAQAIDRAAWTPGTDPAVAPSASDLEIRTAYDALNRVSWVNEGGQVTRFERDGNGNVTRQTRHATAVDVRTWDAQSPSAPSVPALDQVSQTVYDAANRATHMVDGAGGLIAIRYDGNGNVVERVAFAERLPLGTPITSGGLDGAMAALARPGRDARILRVYDAANRLSWSADGMGAVTHQAYDRNGNLVKQVAFATPVAIGASPDNAVPGTGDRVTLMAYDAVNQKTWQVDASGGVTHRGYDAVGNLTSMTVYAQAVAAPDAATDPLSVAAMVAGLSAADPANRTSQAVFDAANRQVLSIDPTGAVTETRYDGIGRGIASIQYAQKPPVQNDAANRHSIQAYDGAGRQVFAVDALGYATRTEYDGLGRVDSTTAYGRSITNRTSPALGLAGDASAIASLLQPDAAVDRTNGFTYDAAGHLLSSRDAMGFEEHFSYDGLGNKLTFRNKKDALWTYEYDAAGRLVTETSPAVPHGEAGAMTPVVTKLTHDALGNLLTRTEAFGLAEQRTTTYTYDAVGRQVRTTFPRVDVYNAAADNLLTNGDAGLAARIELDDVELSSEVTYDAFGDAVANRDVAGNYSYKTYDALGRVTNAVDALGHVTRYARDAFGDARDVTRYASSVTLPPAADKSQVATALAGLSGTGSRTVHTDYDLRGRAVRVTEPQTWVFPGPGQAGGLASKVTVNTYNAFGELEQTGVEVAAQTLVATTHYFDLRGMLVATRDPLGYVTRQEFDAVGNVVERTEFATTFDGLPITAANTSAEDRRTTFTYDLLSRKQSETRHGVAHSNDGVNLSTAPLTTGFTYDRVGNLLTTTDPLGGVTTSEYDALGRVTRVLAPERLVTAPGGATQVVRPETAFYRDAYGNVVLQRQEGAAGQADRETRLRYDSHGHVVTVTDAENIEHHMSYDAHGQLAKQWQAVNGDGTTRTLFTAFRYDALGRATDVITPASRSLIAGVDVGGLVHNRAVYNAFGEVTQRGTYRGETPELQQRFDYDAAGRLVRTNSGDGNYRVMLYNVQGFQTAQITSAGGANGDDLSALNPDLIAQAANGLGAGARRTEVRVDALGRALEQRLPTRYDELTASTLQPVIHQTFDRWGNVLSQSDPRNAALVATFAYDDNNQVIRRTLTGGATTLIRYDALGRQTGVLDANNHLNRQQWDAGGNLVREIHADGGVVNYGYSTFGERTRLVDAMGYGTTYTHDRLGRVTEVRGDTVTIANVDGNFNLSTSTGTLATTYTYDAAGRKLTQTNGAGQTIRYSYDLRGNIIATQQPLGQTSYAAFDEMNRQVAAEDANHDAVTTWDYDHFGQLQSHRDLGGVEHFYHYDRARQLERQFTLTTGKDIGYGYDAAGQLIRINEAGIARQTSFAYDAAGHRTLEQTVQNGQVYQSNILHYDAQGRLDDVRALDNFHITFTYDAVGNKIHQRVEGHGLARGVATTQQIQTGIDENGAPTYTQQTVSTTVFDATVQNLWFAYDSMNRQVLVDGLQANDLTTANINSAQGHLLRYDLNGNRIQDTFWGQQVVGQQVLSYDENGQPVGGGGGSGGAVFGPTSATGGAVFGPGPATGPVAYDENGTLITQFGSRAGVVTEYYGYDRMNRVLSVSTDSLYDVDLNPIGQVVLDRRFYDGAGRMVQNGPAGTLSNEYIEALSGAAQQNGASTRVNQYDANGRLMAQHVAKPDGTLSYDTVYAGTINSTVQDFGGYDENGEPIYYPRIVTTTGPGYDAAGNILGYRVTDGSGVTSNYNMTLARFEGYKENTVSGFRSDNPTQERTTTNQYDRNGHLIGITDNTGSSTAHRTFINDANGMVLQKTQEGRILKQLVVGGELYASYGLAVDPQNPGSYLQEAVFNPNYQPITNLHPSAGTGAYTVRSGDTLEVIAKAAYGDSRLWYLIADANGLRGNSDLRVGQTLNIPTQVGSVHNTSDTFKPYDPSKVIGDTTPELPVPESDDDDCGGLGQIIMIIVAVVVTIYTAGAAAGMLGSTFGATAGAAGAVTIGGTTLTAGGAFLAGAIGGAVGSIASQLVGNALGVVDGFSWKAVAMGALSGGISQGLSGVNFTGGELAGLGNTIARAAIGNAATQGIAVATGLQERFDWKSVAASAIGAGVGWGVGQALGPQTLPSGEVRPAAFSEYGRAGDVLRSGLTGFAAGLATSAARGGKVSITQIAVDAFGNALGTSFADYARSGSQQEATLYSAEEQAQDFAREEARFARQAAANAAGTTSLTPAQQRAMDWGYGPLTAEAAERITGPRNAAAALGSDEMVGTSASGGAPTPSGPATYTAQRGQGPLAVAAGIDGNNPYAAMAYLVATGQIKYSSTANRWNTQPGVEYSADLGRLSPDQVAELEAAGRRLVSAEGKVDAARERARLDALIASAGPRGGTGVAYGDAARVSAAPASPGGRFETRESYDMLTGMPNGGTEQVWVSDGPETPYFESVTKAGVTAGKLLYGAGQMVLSGTYNAVVKIGAGAGSLPYLVDGLDAAVAVQEGTKAKFGWTPQSEGADMIARGLAPVGQVLSEASTSVRSFSERHIGDGATTFLGATLEAGLEIAGVVTGGRAVQGFLDKSVFVWTPMPSTPTLGTIGVPPTLQGLLPTRITTVTDDMSARFQGMGYLDPLSNKIVPGKAGETMAVDHIFPSVEIVKLPGFNTLTKPQMASILQDTLEIGNLQPLPKTFNSSKSSSMNWTNYKGQNLDAVYAAELAQQQQFVRTQIQQQIHIYQQMNKSAPR